MVGSDGETILVVIEDEEDFFPSPVILIAETEKE